MKKTYKQTNIHIMGISETEEKKVEKTSQILENI